ncbi:MAG TPA: diphosphomevalonate decarboxylase [Candidatus Saccharimonadales bacterium]|nr:diphosphomevalonate decarboxylase [Candidatus Saccharimonadales bacterium]
MAILDKVFTAQGSPNIAFIKYWGKRDEKLILPYNSSVSLTLSAGVLRTKTSMVFSKRLKEDALFIDGQRMAMDDKEIRERLWILEKMRKMAGSGAKVLIVSRNDFPAASGLASSASGIATLVYAANSALGLQLSPKELSIIARQGSGSACRSMFGGLVVWRRGSKRDGSDSYAEQAFDERHWPELIDIIAVTSQKRKKVSSRAGMRQTVETNPLYKSRPAAAEARLRKTIRAYGKRDFGALAEQIMADSNEMHALMLSTRPSIRYLNPASFEIMDAVEALNLGKGRNVAAYTFDAGPNAQIITLRKHQKEVLSALAALRKEGKIIEIKISGAGSGPMRLEGESLIDEERLIPK